MLGGEDDRCVVIRVWATQWAAQCSSCPFHGWLHLEQMIITNILHLICVECVCVHTHHCHSTCVEVRGPLGGDTLVSSEWAQVARPGARALACWLSWPALEKFLNLHVKLWPVHHDKRKKSYLLPEIWIHSFTVFWLACKIRICLSLFEFCLKTWLHC